MKKRQDFRHNFTDASIKEFLVEDIDYGCDSTTNFANLHRQADAEITSAPANPTLRLHKLRLTAAELSDDIKKAKRIPNAVTSEDKIRMRNDFQSLAQQMRQFRKDFIDNDAISTAGDADLLQLYRRSVMLISAGLQKDANQYGVILPTSFSFPTYRQTNECLEKIASEAQSRISKALSEAGTAVRPGKITQLYEVVAAVHGDLPLVQSFKNLCSFNKVISGKEQENPENNSLITRYNTLCREVFPNESDANEIERMVDATKLTTEDQDKLFEMLLLNCKILAGKATDPKAKAEWEHKHDFVKHLVELPEHGRHRRVLTCKALAIAGFAILGTALPATIAAASDLAAHGLLQEAVNEAIAQNSLDVFNDKLLSAIQQAMPEFLTIVLVCAVLGGAATLAAALWPDNAPIRAIGNTEVLRDGLKEFEIVASQAKLDKKTTKTN